MLKVKKSLSELIEENKKELINNSGLKSLMNHSPKANETPQIDLLYRDINVLRGEVKRLEVENERLRQQLEYNKR